MSQQTAGFEEEGISYLYFNDEDDKKDSRKSKPFYIGTKRFGGLYCRACKQPLGFSDEKSFKMARAMRKAEKNDENVATRCIGCGTKESDDKKKIIVPCCSFDWYMPPHLLQRLLDTNDQPVAKKTTVEKKKEKNNQDDDDDSDDAEQPQDEESKAKQKKIYKDAITQIESEKPKEVRNTSAQPQLSVKGHIENQYGHVITVEDFFKCIVDPCPMRCYDRIPKHHV